MSERPEGREVRRDPPWRIWSIEIVDIHVDSDGTYGEPRVTAQLHDEGREVNHEIERLMRENGLVGHRPRKRRSLTQVDEDAASLPDLVARLFDPDAIDHTSAGGITYIPTGPGWLYLATVIDLASRRLVGYSMSDRPDATLVSDALKNALAPADG